MPHRLMPLSMMRPTSVVTLDARIQSYFQEHIATAQQTAMTVGTDLAALCRSAIETLTQGGRLFFFGNGGSAADAQHLATELTARFTRKRRALAAMALTTDSSALTAIGNDFGFAEVFARQIEALAKPKDLAIAITTSGKSENIQRGLETAARLELITAALTSVDGRHVLREKLPSLTHAVAIPSQRVPGIQEMHITVGHILCDVIDTQFATS